LIEWKTKELQSLLDNGSKELLEYFITTVEKGMLKLDRDSASIKSQSDQAAMFVPDSRNPQPAPKAPEHGEEIAKSIDQRKTMLANLVATAKEALSMRENRDQAGGRRLELSKRRSDMACGNVTNKESRCCLRGVSVSRLP
jgi:hypothetical protein